MNSVIDVEKLELHARIAEAASKLTWLKVPVAAVYAGISETKMWDLVHAITIPSSKDEGGSIIINRSDIDAYWRERRRALN